MRLLYGVVSLLLLAGESFAQDPSVLAARLCAGIAEPTNRLRCYDTAFPRAAAAPPAAEEPPQAEDSASWDVLEESSPIDDSKTISAFLNAASIQYTGIGSADAGLLLRCKEHRTFAIITTSMFMTSEQVDVTVRIGSADARKFRWDRATNYKAVGLWSGQQAIPFIRSLIGADKLAIRIQDRDRLDATFSLGDLHPVVVKLAAACDWPPEKAR